MHFKFVSFCCKKVGSPTLCVKILNVADSHKLSRMLINRERLPILCSDFGISHFNFLMASLADHMIDVWFFFILLNNDVISFFDRHINNIFINTSILFLINHGCLFN